MADITKEQATEANEYIANGLTRRSIYGERLSASIYQKILKNLIDLEKDLKSQIIEADVNGVSQVAAKRKRLEKLLSEARSKIRKTYRTINAKTATDLRGLVPIEARATQALINTAGASVSFELGAGLPSQAVLAALTNDLIVAGNPLLDYWTKQASNTIDSFQREIRIGVQSGESIDQMAKRIVGTDVNSKNGVIPLSKRSAKTLIRTSVSSINNSARQSVYEANTDIFTALYHLSRLDSHTSKICISRSGKEWDAVTKEPIGHNLPFQIPPLHPSCRSLILPVIIGGQKAPGTNADTWLKSLKRSEVEELLGKNATRLYLDGKITSSELIDQSNRPLTLIELEALS